HLPISTLSLHDALPISAFVIVGSACERAVMILASPIHSYKIVVSAQALSVRRAYKGRGSFEDMARARKEAKFEVFGQEMIEKVRSEEHTSELQSRFDLV